MRHHETVKWESCFFKKNVDNLRNRISEYVNDEFAREVEHIALQPGPLNLCLARTCHENMAISVIVSFLKLVRDKGRYVSASDCVQVLNPLFRWDHGWEPLSNGLNRLVKLPTNIADGLTRFDECDVEPAIEALWLMGLLNYVHTETNAIITNDVGRFDTVRLGLREFADHLSVTIRRTLTKDLPVEWQASGDPQHDRLWYTALASALQYPISLGKRNLYVGFLTYLAEGCPFPFSCQANDAVIGAAPEAFERFWTDVSLPLEEPLGCRIEFMNEPLEVLNLGNAFDTCLRLGGECEDEILGWATNANIRVVALRGQDNRVLSRCTIALSTGRVQGVVRCPVYPTECYPVETGILKFIQIFLKQSGLPSPYLVDRANVEITYAPYYSDGFRQCT